MKILINEWQEFLLKEHIKNNRDNLLIEELGISSDVIEASTKLSTIITNSIKNKTCFYYKDKNDTIIYNGSFSDTVFGNNFMIDFEAYYFEDEKKGNKLLTNGAYNLDSEIFKINDKLYRINIRFYTFDVNVNFCKNPISHELLHFYQDNKDNRLIKKLNQYNIGIENINSNDYELDNIGTVFYLSEYTEQDAFAHDLYSFLTSRVVYKKNEKEEDFKKKFNWFFTNSQPFNYYNKIKQFAEYLKTHKIEREKLAIFKLSSNKQLVAITNKTINDFKTKLNKAAYKALTEISEISMMQKHKYGTFYARNYK